MTALTHARVMAGEKTGDPSEPQAVTTQRRKSNFWTRTDAEIAKTHLPKDFR